MFFLDLLDEPVYLPPDGDLAGGVSYSDLVLVVRGGVPALKVIDRLQLDPAVIDRLRADGIVDAALKPIRPIGHCSPEYVDCDTALIRLFALPGEIAALGQIMGYEAIPEVTDPEEIEALGIPTYPRNRPVKSIE